MDRAAVVAIIGQASTKHLHKESHQNMDAIGMCRPISKWAHTIYDLDNIAEVVRKAFKIGETEKPGVSVIELPEDMAKGEVDEKPMEPIRRRKSVRGECWPGWRWSDDSTVSPSCIGRAKVATSR